MLTHVTLLKPRGGADVQYLCRAKLSYEEKNVSHAASMRLHLHVASLPHTTKRDLLKALLRRCRVHKAYLRHGHARLHSLGQQPQLGSVVL